MTLHPHEIRAALDGRLKRIFRLVEPQPPGDCRDLVVMRNQIVAWETPSGVKLPCRPCIDSPHQPGDVIEAGVLNRDGENPAGVAINLTVQSVSVTRCQSITEQEAVEWGIEDGGNFDREFGRMLELQSWWNQTYPDTWDQNVFCWTFGGQ